MVRFWLQGPFLGGIPPLREHTVLFLSSLNKEVAKGRGCASGGYLGAVLGSIVLLPCVDMGVVGDWSRTRVSSPSIHSLCCALVKRLRGLRLPGNAEIRTNSIELLSTQQIGGGMKNGDDMYVGVPVSRTLHRPHPAPLRHTCINGLYQWTVDALRLNPPRRSFDR